MLECGPPDGSALLRIESFWGLLDIPGGLEAADEQIPPRPCLPHGWQSSLDSSGRGKLKMSPVWGFFCTANFAPRSHLAELNCEHAANKAVLKVGRIDKINES